MPQIVVHVGVGQHCNGTGRYEESATTLPKSEDVDVDVDVAYQREYSTGEHTHLA